MNNYSLTITANGTASQVASRLIEFAAKVHNEVNAGRDIVRMTADDSVFFAVLEREDQ